MQRNHSRQGEGGRLYRYEHFRIVSSNSIIDAIWAGLTTQTPDMAP
jgi:hypothetical protein